MAATKEDVFGFIDSMTIMEMSEFIKEFEERYGVTAAAPVAAAAAAPAGGGEAAVAEEKTSFDVVLSSAGDKKIQVIKVVRELTGPGPQGSKGAGGQLPKGSKDRRQQGRGRRSQGQTRGAGSHRRGQVVPAVDVMGHLR